MSNPQPGQSEVQARFVALLDVHLNARYPLLYLVSWEEQRVDALLQGLATKHGRDLVAWTITRGLHRVSGKASAFGDSTKDPMDALAAIAKLTSPSIVVLKDFHPYLNDPTIIRAVRDVSQRLKTANTTLFILSPVLNLPVELEKEASLLDVPLPTFDELANLLREIIHVLWQGSSASVKITNEDGARIVRAALGLTLSEAENAFAKAIAHDNTLSGDAVPIILEEKRQVIRKSGLLAYYAPEPRPWSQSLRTGSRGPPPRRGGQRWCRLRDGTR